MILIPTQAVPAQSLSVNLDGARYDLRLVALGEGMAISVSRDDAPLVENTRLLPATPVLPYAHQEAGNFVCLTEGDLLPSYEALGATQTLVYLSAAELAALRG